MADRKEDKDTADNRAQNAEEYDCLRQGLATLIKQVEVLAKAIKDLHTAQIESRSDLTRRINGNEDRIDHMVSRIDGVYDNIASKANELREDSARLIHGAETRIKKVREDLSQRLVYTNKRVDYLREDLSERLVYTNKRVDYVREDLSDKHGYTNKRVDYVREDLSDKHGYTNKRIDDLRRDISKK